MVPEEIKQVYLELNRVMEYLKNTVEYCVEIIWSKEHFTNFSYFSRLYKNSL